MHLSGESMATFIPTLQYRWKVKDDSDPPVLLYYGLRNYPLTSQRMRPVSESMAKTLHRFDGRKSLAEILEGGDERDGLLDELNTLVDENIVVRREDRRRPASSSSYRTCVKCVNNDHVLPGLEFDENDVCALCQCHENIPDEEVEFFIGGNTITDDGLLELKKQNRSAFDVLVLYTGGKDSSYLLWHLSKKLGLDVLACTWDMPFTNKTSWKNMKAAQKKLPGVEWIVRTVNRDRMKPALRELVKRFGGPCICPFMAYALFYPVAYHEKIPVIMDGIESSQTNIFKALAPPATGERAELTDDERTLRFLNNIAQPKTGKNLTEVDAIIDTLRTCMAPSYAPLKTILDQPEKGDLPRIKRLQSELVYESWKDVADLLKREIDWQAPPNQFGLLHTSCDIEMVKDYISFKLFRNMSTMGLPQSIIEISSAIYYGHVSREEGLKELSERGYYAIPRAFRQLVDRLDLTRKDIAEMPDPLRPVYEEVMAALESPDGA